jgi:hypothetical protein
MEPSDLSVQILRSIRDEVRQTNARLDQTNSGIESLREELSRRIVESELRTATAIVELAGSVREMTGVLRTSADLRPRVERCEKDISDLRERFDQLKPPAS